LGTSNAANINEMSHQPYEFTVVVKNNVPDRLLGVKMADLFGFTPVFISDQNGLKIQWQFYYCILEADSLNKLFEYRTASNFIISQRIGDEHFFEVIHDHLLTGLQGFNWHFERNKSYLTMGKSFSPVPDIEQIKKPVIDAWLAFTNPAQPED